MPRQCDLLKDEHFLELLHEMNEGQEVTFCLDVSADPILAESVGPDGKLEVTLPITCSTADIKERLTNLSSTVQPNHMKFRM